MKLPLASFRLKNFKAVRDSKVIKFTPLTVFIGNNGSGKSSIIEGLQTYQSILTQGLDEAMIQWRGFENIRNAAVPHKPHSPKSGKSYLTNPVEFLFRCNVEFRHYENSWHETAAFGMSITTTPSGDQLFIQSETFKAGDRQRVVRDKEGHTEFEDDNLDLLKANFPDGLSLISALRTSLDAYRNVYDFVSDWQFVLLNPVMMGNPKPQRRTGNTVRLAYDGSNIAEFLLDIRQQSLEAFEGIIETLQYVLPYARDIQPTLTSELERSVYLQLTEENFKIPGWLLSTGTLRVLALLALFRHPSPPPLIVIEEIENGLDPRTIHLIVEELRNVIETGLTQVIITTHSPYLLDLLALSQIVLVERIDGQPTFLRPGDQVSLEEWAKSFGPGRLYTMNRLSSEAK